MGNYNMFEAFQRIQRDYNQILGQRESISYKTYENEDVIETWFSTNFETEEKVFEFKVGY